MTKHGLPMAWIGELLAAPETDDCVPWPFTRTKEGYSRVWHGKRMYPAYRLVCEMAHGKPQAKSLQAAHSCGNGRNGCMNPKHLRWATRSENEADKIAHGTVSRGEANGSAKLSSADVETIREIAPFATHATLARHYGICPAQVSRIVNGQRWAV